MNTKPLFVPLKTRWFRQFESGEKETEYRAYGPRWNERTCAIGREAVLSHGYSGSRLRRRVAGFSKLAAIDAPEAAREIYPGAAFIAAIHLRADAETDRTAPENASLLGGVPSAPDHTTMEERGR